MITYSDSTRKTVQENVFCLYGSILNLVTKVAQTLPKSDQFLSSMQTGRCDPYENVVKCYEKFACYLYPSTSPVSSSSAASSASVRRRSCRPRSVSAASSSPHLNTQRYWRVFALSSPLIALLRSISWSASLSFPLTALKNFAAQAQTRSPFPPVPPYMSLVAVASSRFFLAWHRHLTKGRRCLIKRQ